MHVGFTIEIAGITTCTPCPSGTYSEQAGEGRSSGALENRITAFCGLLQDACFLIVSQKPIPSCPPLSLANFSPIFHTHYHILSYSAGASSCTGTPCPRGTYGNTGMQGMEPCKAVRYTSRMSGRGRGRGKHENTHHHEARVTGRRF